MALGLLFQDHIEAFSLFSEGAIGTIHYLLVKNSRSSGDNALPLVHSTISDTVLYLFIHPFIQYTRHIDKLQYRMNLSLPTNNYNKVVDKMWTHLGAEVMVLLLTRILRELREERYNDNACLFATEIEKKLGLV
jgi:hypothetical protein